MISGMVSHYLIQSKCEAAAKEKIVPLLLHYSYIR